MGCRRGTVVAGLCLCCAWCSWHRYCCGCWESKNFFFWWRKQKMIKRHKERQQPCQNKFTYPTATHRQKWSLHGLPMPAQLENQRVKAVMEEKEMKTCKKISYLSYLKIRWYGTANRVKKRLLPMRRKWWQSTFVLLRWTPKARNGCTEPAWR